MSSALASGTSQIEVGKADFGISNMQLCLPSSNCHLTNTTKCNRSLFDNQIMDTCSKKCKKTKKSPKHDLCSNQPVHSPERLPWCVDWILGDIFDVNVAIYVSQCFSKIPHSWVCHKDELQRPHNPNKILGIPQESIRIDRSPDKTVY
jgi:hypothetical protein